MTTANTSKSPALPSVVVQRLVRLIVCAAIRKSGHVICGARHMDNLMREQIRAMFDGRPNALKANWGGWEQGFVDNMGVFLTREEAWEVANAAGQIRLRCGGDNGRLFSENLY